LKGQAARRNSLLVSVLGAVTVVLCGLILWATSLGDSWVNSSYDNLFRFNSRAVTNKVTLILMDNAAFDQFHQTRGQPWDRSWHARLLNRLADDGCSLVVLDSFFSELHDPVTDEVLAAAMRRQHKIVLMAELSPVTHPEMIGGQPTLPADLFRNAAKTNWGVAWLDPDADSVVRRLWPFPSPGAYTSLPWQAAELAGAKLSREPQERWLRYYGRNGRWTRMSYRYALTQPASYFRDQIVFIGNQPKTLLPDGETDKFSTPYTRWTRQASGGVDILLTSFLNLLNNDALLRPPGWIEVFLLIVVGIALGGGLCRLRRSTAIIGAFGIFFAVSLTAIFLSCYTNFWFPWLIVAGGQVPCALMWTMMASSRFTPVRTNPTRKEPLPKTPGYELIHPPFAEGSYGKVWLARNGAAQWVALKVIYRAKFGDNPEPYEREFNGVQKYQSICDKHSGLLLVDFVSEKRPDYFYYAMELGDSLTPDWEQTPENYRPRALIGEFSQSGDKRLPVKDCLRIGINLCESLDFLHQQGMAHRDIKPQNIIFVNGQPKLADLGLVTDIRPSDQERTIVGTPGYMPPAPERPGTVAADVYALGMVLYVLSTGRPTRFFPEADTTLVNSDEPSNFLPLSLILLQACQPLPADRYASAAQMGNALAEALKRIEKI
jgi:CHASE2 domain-containing sensor protein